MSLIKYVKESFYELNHKMTWLSRSKAQNLTVVVAAFTVVFAIIVHFVDQFFQSGLQGFFNSL